MLSRKLERDCNADLDDIYNQLITLQSVYINANAEIISKDPETNKDIIYTFKRKQYWQGILTHDIIPSNGVRLSPDKTKREVKGRETGGTKNWLEIGIDIPDTMLFAASVDVYELPSGDNGWVLNGVVIEDDIKYIKSMNFGNDTSRENDWIEVVFEI